MKLEFQKIESFEKIYFKFTRKFFMVLKFLELEYSGKLDFAKLEYPKSSKSLYIFGTMVNYNIVCKKGLFGYFRPILTKPKFYKHSYLSSPGLPLSLSLSLSLSLHGIIYTLHHPHQRYVPRLLQWDLARIQGMTWRGSYRVTIWEEEEAMFGGCGG